MDPKGQISHFELHSYSNPPDSYHWNGNYLPLCSDGSVLLLTTNCLFKDHLVLNLQEVPSLLRPSPLLVSEVKSISVLFQEFNVTQNRSTLDLDTPFFRIADLEDNDQNDFFQRMAGLSSELFVPPSKFSFISESGLTFKRNERARMTEKPRFKCIFCSSIECGILTEKRVIDSVRELLASQGDQISSDLNEFLNKLFLLSTKKGRERRREETFRQLSLI